MISNIISNYGIFDTLYNLIICFICFVIVLKTDRMFKLSDHQGLRYFRNSFFFYGLAFAARIIISSASSGIGFYIAKIGFEFFIITAGLSLFYSLSRKYIENGIHTNSLLNFQMIMFYVLSIIFSVGDYILGVTFFIHLSQILLFSLMAIFTYRNYSNKNRRYEFSIYYFLTIVLGLLIWVFDFLSGYFLDIKFALSALTILMTLLFFIFFLYAILKMSNKK